MSGKAEALLALAERCEKAGLSGELDRMIFAADHGWTYPLQGAALAQWDSEGQPDYCASVDAALSLVPEDHTFALWQDHRGNCAQVRRPSVLSRGVVEPIVQGATTPALALCAAALRIRARAATPEADGREEG